MGGFMSIFKRKSRLRVLLLGRQFVLSLSFFSFFFLSFFPHLSHHCHHAHQTHVFPQVFGAKWVNQSPNANVVKTLGILKKRWREHSRPRDKSLLCLVLMKFRNQAQATCHQRHVLFLGLFVSDNKNCLRSKKKWAVHWACQHHYSAPRISQTQKTTRRTVCWLVVPE